MFPTQQNSILLFRALGINVRVHWTWAILLVYVLSTRQGLYSSPLWTVFETVSLFAIVLLHEYGHALATRQVGGRSEEIMLWPFGGVAYVQAPPRPGAQLWSIVAGPLVNVVLLPVLWLLGFAMSAMGVANGSQDFWRWFQMLQLINLVLLIFNLLPVYPLDGGQILRSLLWYGVGPRRSLLYASAVGLVGVAGLLIWALSSGSIWLGVLVLLLGQNCWQAFQTARAAPEPPPRPPSG